jgi:hypothetical protein
LDEIKISSRLAVDARLSLDLIIILAIQLVEEQSSLRWTPQPLPWNRQHLAEGALLLKAIMRNLWGQAVNFFLLYRSIRFTEKNVPV